MWMIDDERFCDFKQFDVQITKVAISSSTVKCWATFQNSWVEQAETKLGAVPHGDVLNWVDLQGGVKLVRICSNDIWSNFCLVKYAQNGFLS